MSWLLVNSFWQINLECLSPHEIIYYSIYSGKTKTRKRGYWKQLGLSEYQSGLINDTKEMMVPVRRERASGYCMVSQEQNTQVNETTMSGSECSQMLFQVLFIPLGFTFMRLCSLIIKSGFQGWTSCVWKQTPFTAPAPLVLFKNWGISYM